MKDLIDVREKMYSMIDCLEGLKLQKQYIDVDAAIYLYKKNN